MTENEVFEHISNLAGDYKCFDEKISHQESLMLCNLIEEIQQYRAIGTVEEFKALKDINRIADNLSKMERIEFKALKEKEERFDRNIRMFNEIGLEIRANAIDEFTERIKTNSELGYIGYLDRVVDEIAEQMKGDGKNE